MSEKRAELRKKAMSLPLLPGVYIMKNAENEIIYIGKAKALKTVSANISVRKTGILSRCAKWWKMWTGSTTLSPTVSLKL